MAAKLETQSEIFSITGDGVATSATLALDGWPFIKMPKVWVGNVTTTLNGNGSGNIASISTNGRFITLNFATAFTGNVFGISIDFSFDLP